MEKSEFQPESLAKVKTPCYIVDEGLLEANLKIISSVKERTGCRILLALKAFSMFSTFPIIRKYLDGVCASSPNEARLGQEEFKKEVHTFGAAYSEGDMQKIIKCSDYIIFNSFEQYRRYKDIIPDRIKRGIRINPEYSEVKVDLYNPCAKNSRLGVTLKNFKEDEMDGITGLHFHVMCEQNSDTLKRVLAHVENKFGKYIKKVEWVNFGGGHHITRKDYDVDLLCKLVKDFQDKHNVKVILEPGEAVALNTGFLVASVLDIVNNGMDIAILDTSAETHMPDVLAMPYRPIIIGSDKPKVKKHTYRLAGPSCLAGDVIGDYSFDKPLQIGQKLVFTDMAHYSMVKNTTFNGINLPSILIRTKEGKIKVVREFGYKDFRNRLS